MIAFLNQRFLDYSQGVFHNFSLTFSITLKDKWFFLGIGFVVWGFHFSDIRLWTYTRTNFSAIEFWDQTILFLRRVFFCHLFPFRLSFLLFHLPYSPTFYSSPELSLEVNAKSAHNPNDQAHAFICFSWFRCVFLFIQP